MITGPSGAGKGTLISELAARVSELEVAISATTRPQRPGELDGREYWFLSDAEFLRRVDAGEFLEYVDYVSGRRYGTLRSELERIARNGRVCVLELELEGALRVQEEVAGSVTIFIACRRRRARAAAPRARNGVDGGDRGPDRARAAAAGAGAPLSLHGSQRRRRTCDGGAGGGRPAGAGVRRYHARLMIEPRIDDLLEGMRAGQEDETIVPSRYALVIVAAKRARQINSYHHQLGEGMGFEEAPPPLIESRSKNYLTMAMEEVSQGKIKYSYTA